MSVLIALILGKVSKKKKIDQNLNSPNLFSSHFIYLFYLWLYLFNIDVLM